MCILFSHEQLVYPVLAVAGKPETEVDLEQYFKSTKRLHCTTKFCDYGKADGCREYAQKQVCTRMQVNLAETSVVLA